MQRCIHRSEQVGDIFHVCCNGREDRRPLYRCDCSQVPQDYCSDEPPAMQPIEIGGVRDLAGVAGLKQCEHRQRMEQMSEIPGQSKAARMWAELRSNSRHARQMTDEQKLPFEVWNVWTIDPPKPQALSGPTRHLAFHLAPIAASETWELACRHVRDRLWMFDGLRRVGVMTGGNMIPVERVAAELPGCEIVPLANDPALREVVSWEPLLAPIVEQPGVVWWGHGKGVSRNVNDGETTHRWARTCYELCLDYWPFAETLLRKYPIVGPFKKVGRGFAGSASAWHYSGGMFWATTDSLRQRNWRHVDRVWWGTEAWPGVHYAADVAGCIFGGGVVPSLDLYSMRYWVDNLWPALQEWEHSHEAFRLR